LVEHTPNTNIDISKEKGTNMIRLILITLVLVTSNVYADSVDFLFGSYHVNGNQYDTLNETHNGIGLTIDAYSVGTFTNTQDHTSWYLLYNVWETDFQGLDVSLKAGGVTGYTPYDPAPMAYLIISKPIHKSFSVNFLLSVSDIGPVFAYGASFYYE